jgi:hypothetical protein
MAPSKDDKSVDLRLQVRLAAMLAAQEPLGHTTAPKRKKARLWRAQTADKPLASSGGL